ncbi:MAG: hypothetical protein WBO55_16630 [Rhizobiaceae bacterium]
MTTELKIELMNDSIAREMDGYPTLQLVNWAQDLLTGEVLETETGLPYTKHHRAGTAEFDRNLRALVALLARNAAPPELLLHLAVALAPQTRGYAYPFANFVHSSRNNQDIRRDSFLAREVGKLKKKGIKDEDAFHEIAERYGLIGADSVKRIWQRYKPARKLKLL